MKKIKKEYIAPSVDIHAFNFESMLMAGTVTTATGSKGDGVPNDVEYGGGDNGEGEAAKMFSSGMSWDEEE